MKIDEIIKEIIKTGKRKNDPLIIKSILLYYGAILLNRYSIKKEIDTLPNRINYLTLIFANSGSGKSYLINQIESLCGLENYAEQRINVYLYLCSLLEEEPDKEILKFLQGNSYSLGIKGTKEGLFKYCKAYSASQFGSINIQTDEVGDSIITSKELFEYIKQMYDGKLQKKIIQGDKDSEPEDDIYNIIVNFLGMGSKDALNRKTAEQLKMLIKSGIYRRAICIDSSLEIEKKPIEKIDRDKIIEWFNYLNNKWKEILAKKISNYRAVGSMDTIMLITDKAYKQIDIIDDELIKIAKQDRLNEFKQFDTGSLDVIVNIAYIIAFLEDKNEVDDYCIGEAYSFFRTTRDTVIETFQEAKSHKEIYRILNLKGGLTHSEIMDISKSNVIPNGKKLWNDTISLVEELCYRENRVLKQNKGKVVRYFIEELPITNLRKLIFGFSADNNGAKTIAYKSVELDWKDIEKLVKSEKVESFTTSWFEPSKQTSPDGHRKADNAIEGQNIVCFDIDYGLSIEEAKQLFNNFTYCLYTTKSHQIEKGEFGDRFRIIVPTKTIFYVTPEQHKQLLINIEDMLGLKNNDTATRNISRLWFTNPNAEIVYVNSGELFDVSGLMPDTNANEKYLNIVENLDYDEVDNRINGIMKYYASFISKGNRNHSLFKLGCFLIEIGDINWEDKLLNLATQTNFPEQELNTLIKGLYRKYNI